MLVLGQLFQVHAEENHSKHRSPTIFFGDFPSSFFPEQFFFSFFSFSSFPNSFFSRTDFPNSFFLALCAKFPSPHASANSIATGPPTPLVNPVGALFGYRVDRPLTPCRGGCPVCLSSHAPGVGCPEGRLSARPLRPLRFAA